MKKKVRIAVGTVIGIAVIGISGTLIYQHYPHDAETYGTLEPIREREKITDVKVKINTEAIEIPEYREITDTQTGEKVIAEVQVNEPIEKKDTTPPEKPKAEGVNTNPDKPPEYKKEQVVVEKKQQTTPSSKPKNNTASAGKVYVDGFGYVDKAGTTQTQTGVSSGDINKMVGSMD